MSTIDQLRALPASDLFGWGDLAEVTPPTTEQVHEWLKQEQAARMHDWQRYQVLLCAARTAVNSGCMGDLSHVLLQLRDPRWKPNSNYTTES